MSPLSISAVAIHRRRSGLRGTISSAVAALAFLALAAALGACGDDSTAVESTAGLPSAGSWYAVTFDSERVPFEYGGNMRLDSAWHVIDASGRTRLFVASSDDRFVVTVDTINGRFVRGDDAGNIELLYDSEPGSGDPYPPSPVTVTRDSITIEDGVTHLIDVYVSRP